MKNAFILTTAVAMSALAMSALPCAAKAELDSENYGNPSHTATTALVDLDGDGKKELVRLVPASNKPEESRYKLFVGGQSISGELNAAANLHIYVVDINRSDRYKEVIVRLDDIHADFDSKVYSFDGRRLRLAGSISGIEAVIKGDGTISEQSWRGFWTSTDTFRLSRAHKLVKVPRRFYPVNKPGSTIKALPLRAGIGSSRVSATLKAGTRVMVVKSDLNDWYLVRAQGGAQGWVKSRELHLLIAGLPIGD